MIIYLDNCCFNRPYDDQSVQTIRLETEAKLYIQTFIREEKIGLMWSFMLYFENEANPYEDQKEEIWSWKMIASEYMAASEPVKKRAKEIEKAHGLKPKDAVHLACAIEGHCNYFLSTDKQLLKKTVQLMEIKTINTVDFIAVLEEIT